MGAKVDPQGNTAYEDSVDVMKLVAAMKLPVEIGGDSCMIGRGFSWRRLHLVLVPISVEIMSVRLERMASSERRLKTYH